MTARREAEARHYERTGEHCWVSDASGDYWCPCGHWEDHAPPNEAKSLRFIAHIPQADQRRAFEATHRGVYGRDDR